MKAIMISDKPKWCALMMNGKKTIEVRTSKALAKAIQKLIDEYGYAEIYVYCTKGKEKLITYDKYLGSEIVNGYAYTSNKKHIKYGANDILNGKVVFKFRCYKVEKFDLIEENKLSENEPNYHTKYNEIIRKHNDVAKKSCMRIFDLVCYCDTKALGTNQKETGYAIHISDLVIFDKPKELSEFKTLKRAKAIDCFVCDVYQLTEMCIGNRCLLPKSLIKAPQSFCYIEV